MGPVVFTPLGSENVMPTGREREGVVGGVVPLRFRGDSEDFKSERSEGQSPYEKERSDAGDDSRRPLQFIGKIY